MVSTFEVDVNCSYCFNDIVSALGELATVTDVQGSMATGCVSITHDGDEPHLADVITDIGHRFVIAGNGEIVQDQLHAVAGHTCHIGR
jgi:copper chaperone CopZ